MIKNKIHDKKITTKKYLVKKSRTKNETDKKEKIDKATLKRSSFLFKDHTLLTLAVMPFVMLIKIQTQEKCSDYLLELDKDLICFSHFGDLIEMLLSVGKTNIF